jgi:hypothetical protein
MGLEIMKTRLLMRLISGVAAIVLCLIALAMAGGQTDEQGQEQAGEQKAAEDSQDSDITEMRLRAKAAIQEANEAEKAELEQAEAIKTNRYLEELGYVPSGKILNDEEVAAAKSQREEKEKAVRAKLKIEAERLEQIKARALEAKGTVTTGRDQTGARIAKPVLTRGMVTGIVFSDKGGAALIDGEIVRENDTIHNVKVVKILRDSVEFDKNGQKWKQRVRQTPDASWPTPVPVSAPTPAPAAR